MKVTTGTIARTAVLVVSLLNVLLNAFGTVSYTHLTLPTILRV